MELPRRCPRCGTYRFNEKVKKGIVFWHCGKCGYTICEGGKALKTERYIGSLGKFK